MTNQDQSTIALLSMTLYWITSVAEEGDKHWLAKEIREHVKYIETKHA